MEESTKNMIASKEPETSLLLRTSIITYELGAVIHDIVYASRFNDQRDVYLAHAKSNIIDVIVQMELLCRQLKYDFEDMRNLGWEKLVDRYKDFEKEGWAKE